jgi:Beta-fructosidases (levanase/invertase)
MNAHEAEVDMWTRRLDTYHNPEGDFLLEGFRPIGGYIADFTIISDGSRFHLFYIERRQEGNPAWPGHEIYFGHSSTDDFSCWKTHDPVMLIRPGTWEGNHVFAPYILRHNRQYVMFYTGLNGGNAQSLGMAFSKDLFTWERYHGNPIIQPAFSEWACWERHVVSSCRDPHIYVEDGLAYLYYTAIRKTGESCIALATSKDWENWTDVGPVFYLGRDYAIPMTGPRHVESAYIEKMGNKYYLLYGHNGGVRYNVSHSPRHFDPVEGDMIWEGFTGIEIIARQEARWLVCAFRQGLLHLGILDWSEPSPHVVIVTKRNEIAGWL